MIFENQSVRKKIIMSILLITTIISLIICGISISYKMVTLRYDMVKNSTTLAQITAYNTTASLAFGNEKDAQIILSALIRDPHIISAGLYKTNGELFAYYFQDKSITNTASLPTVIKENGYNFRSPTFEIWQSVDEEDKKLGNLYIEYDLTPIYKRIELYSGVILLTMFLSWGVAFFIAVKIQKNISAPILSLTETAKKFVNSKDDSIRAKKFTHDEVGVLVDAFNEMLDYIQEQKENLRQSELHKEEELKKLVAERTVKLESINKELESFSYSVSHDLRAPLRGLTGYAQLLSDRYGDKLETDGKRIVGILKVEAFKMGQLIDELLKFSRLSRQELNTSNINMNQLFRSVYKELKDMTPDRNIEFVIGDLPSSNGDEILIRQVVVNILSNAIKFSRNRDKAIIEVGYNNQNGEEVYYVKDNGAGFDMKYYNKLFGVFQRLHRQEEFEGTGVGLALVHRIIQRHGGRVWAEGKVDEGATFYFTLPKNTT